MSFLKTVWIRLVRFGFRLLYYELAWTYDLVSWIVSLGEWSRWQRAALPFLNGRKILEIGHGPGHLLVAMAQAGKQVVGVDLSPFMGRQAAWRLKRAAVSASLIRTAVQTLPFAPGSFEGVLATFPTDYVVDPDSLAALFRVLQENGRFVVVPEGHLTGKGVSRWLIDGLFRLTGQRSDSFAVDDEGYWPSNDIWQPLLDRFESAGFLVEIEQVQFARSAATVLIAIKKE